MTTCHAPLASPRRLPARAILTAATLALALALAAMLAPARARGQDSTASAAHATPAVVKHVVKPGDTLWEIARTYLRDPFRWPEVFHANTDIVRNPHWIYPGQVLSIDGSAVKPEIAARVGPDGFVAARVRAAPVQPPAPAPATATVFLAAAPAEQTAPAISMLEPPPALTVRPGEYEAAPYLVPRRTSLGAGAVLGAVERLALGLRSDAGFRLPDRIYVSPPAGPVPAVGEELLLARTDRSIPDAGTIVIPTGVARVDSVPSAHVLIAHIVRQFDVVNVDQVVLPLDHSFHPTTERPAPGSYAVSAKSLWIKNSPVLPSLQSYVLLATGSDASLRPGDQFTLFDDRPAAVNASTPPVATATVTVVRVSPGAATAIVVDQTQPEIRVGMPARLTAKMP